MKHRISVAAVLAWFGLLCIIASFFSVSNVLRALLLFGGMLIGVPSAVVAGAKRRKNMKRVTHDSMAEQIAENMERAAAMSAQTVLPESEAIAQQMWENLAKARELEGMSNHD